MLPVRIAVADVLGWLAAGMTHEEILSDYPELTEEDIRVVLLTQPIVSANQSQLRHEQLSSVPGPL